MSDGVKRDENYAIDNNNGHRPPNSLTTDDLDTSAVRLEAG